MVAVKPVLFVGLTLLCIAEVTIVSFSTVAWLVPSGYGDRVYIGLFRFCVEFRDKSDCNDLENFPDAVHGVRTTAAIGGLLGFLSVLCASLMLFKISKGKPLNPAVCICFSISSVFANVCMSLSAGLYGGLVKKEYNKHFNFGHSFYLAIVAAVFFAVSGWLIRLGSKDVLGNHTCGRSQPRQAVPLSSHPPGQIMPPPGSYPAGYPQPYDYGQPQQKP